MNTRIIMIASAVYLGICGLGLTFLPEEIAEHLDIGKNQSATLSLQILGSLYLGFAMLNWMTKNNVIGGIYSKPLVVGNLSHFLISSLTLLKIVGKYEGTQFSIILLLTIIYCVFTLCFAYLFMTSPGKRTATD